MYLTKMLLDQAKDDFIQAMYAVREAESSGFPFPQERREMLIAERKVKDLEYQYYSELRERDIRNLEVYKERSN